jgi:hypothetical protein
MCLETRINTVSSALRALVRRLTERSFEFERPAEVLPGPEEGTAEAIARIESEIGSLPLALKLFWEKVGSVDLCGSHPEWMGCDYPDPLVVYPPSVAIRELGEFLCEKEERLRCNVPYRVPVAPDFYHKANVSGGMWYNISVPAVADDPPLNDELHGISFVNYLELAVKWAGFPGLSQSTRHAWPISELVGSSVV